MVIETRQGKKPMGKFGNMVRLNIWIMSAQNDELKRITKICGMSTTDAVGEALQVWINTMRRMGV